VLFRSDPGLAAAKLAWWRTELDAVYEGKPQHPVAQALQAVVRRIPLARENFQEILDGMEMDLNQARYADFKALNLYCHRVAGVVGQLSAEIFGYKNRQTLKYAHELGLAFQLTNIIRDVGEDARRGRIYLPMDDLRRFQVPAADILQSRHSDAFRELMEFQGERADYHYQQAETLLPQEDRKAQRPGLIMAAIYRTLLEEIRADGFQVLDRRTSLPPLRKLWIAGKTWLRS
jgi:phytoene synthase